MPLPEQLLISKIAQASGFGYRSRPPSRRGKQHVITGIGDDCAVLRVPHGHEILVTTDFSLEGVHFRRDWHSPEIVGHRCLTRGLSDIAAMGGVPIAAFLSLAVSPKLAQKWIDAFMNGFLKLARQFDVTLAGGDTSQSQAGILADIVVVGSVPVGKAVLRSGARRGDRIYVTGALGGSAALLNLLASGRKLQPGQSASYFFPTPRVQVGQLLREKRIASGMIDISDGLSTDLNHICQESGVGAVICEEAIPRCTIGKPPQSVELKYALHGGEDYELLFTTRRGTRVPTQLSGVPITCIGEITGGRQLSLMNKDGTRRKLKVRGWEHFRKLSER